MRQVPAARAANAFLLPARVGPATAADATGGHAVPGGTSRTSTIRLHHGALKPDGTLARPDQILSMADEPGHDELCEREQAFFLDAILNDRDLSDHMADAVNSLRIVLAADQSIREGRVITLP